MIKKLLAKQKLELIKRAEAGEKAPDLCHQFKISRALFYRICTQYRSFGNFSQDRTFRQVSSDNRELILSIVKEHPDYSSKIISKNLPKVNGKPVVGNHGVQNVLVRLGLSTWRRRLEFAAGKRHLPQDGKLVAGDRLHIIKKVLDGAKVADVCRQYGISRTVFYRLLRRYKQSLARGEASREQILSNLRDQPPIPYHPWRQTPIDIENIVLDIVTHYPELSAHRIVLALPKVEGRPLLSNKGVQNVLRRNHLSTYEQRLSYSRMAEAAWKPRWRFADIPTIPLHIWRMLYAPFATIPKLSWLFTRGQFLLLLTLVIGFYFFQILKAIIISPTGTVVGTFFASVSLTFGLFFFIYSVKYYISVILVLRLAQSGGVVAKGTEGIEETEGIFGVILKFLHLRGVRSFHLGGVPVQRINPLLVNLEKVELDADNRPFVSIHVAVYNEKRVVERLIGACTSQNWKLETGNWKQGGANYELVIVDDSTDETTEIAKQALVGGGWSVVKSANSSTSSVSVNTPGVKGAHTPGVSLQGEPSGRALGADNQRSSAELELFTFTKPNAPTVKLIHRFSRSGFKGGALQVALENTEARAAYITVFDADFVPYADTIEQFVKTFQVLNANVDANDKARMDANERMGNISINSQNYNSQVNSHVIAAVQGYQWHVLNKSQTWVTRGVRTEYAGSYVIERSSSEIYGGLKQIAGAVYMIRADILRQFGWGTSITEDFELTLRLYEAGYKVAFTPYIQAPAEAVSTIRRLVRQRMRWAEGASFNVKKMLSRMLFGRWETDRGSTPKAQSTPSGVEPLGTAGVSLGGEDRVWVPSRLTLAEKLEFAYLAPYYLQAAFFVVGTFSWFLAEAILGSRLPFWSAAFGWSLVFTNLLALPLMNIIGLFLEESDERDYVGVLSFVALSYIVVPFQAYAAIKGFLEREEGPWFRTPKTGLVTDVFGRSGFGKFFGQLLGKPATAPALPAGRQVGADIRANQLVLVSAYNKFDNFRIQPKRMRWVSRVVLIILLVFSVTVFSATHGVPEVLATNPSGTFLLYNDASAVITGTVSWQLKDTSVRDTLDTVTRVSFAKNAANNTYMQWAPNVNNSTTQGTDCSTVGPDGRGWVYDVAFGSGGTIAAGTWTLAIRESDDNSNPTGHWDVCVWRVTVSGGGTINTSTLLFTTEGMAGWPTTDIWNAAVDNPSTATASQSAFSLGPDEYLYLEYYNHVTADTGQGGTRTATFATGDVTETNDPLIATPAITIPENAIVFLTAVPLIPYLVHLFIIARRKPRQKLNI